MYEAHPTVRGYHGSAGEPAWVREVQVAPERKRDPAQRRWRVRYLKPDGEVYYEDWVHAYTFRRCFFATELEAWEGLLELEQERLVEFQANVVRCAREVGELEQQVRFKRWKAQQTPAAS
jgi:hypothetical protein